MDEKKKQKIIEKISATMSDSDDVKTFTARMPLETYRLLKMQAVLKDVTLQEALVEAVEYWLENQG